MPRDYLTTEEQEAYDTVIRLINQYVYGKAFKEELISKLDYLIDVLLTEGDW